MAVIKVRNSKSRIVRALGYVTKREKTERKLISGSNCHPDLVVEQMLETKRNWKKEGGRTYKHYIQSFSPEENITPEQAHEIAKLLVQKNNNWKGYEVLIATHQDRDHLHTHFIINSVGYADGKKFQEKKTDLQAAKDLSDEICRDNNLVITQKGKSFSGADLTETTSFYQDTYQFFKRAQEQNIRTYVADTAMAIMKVKAIATSPADFFQRMNEEGYRVENWEKKHITFVDLEREEQAETKKSVRNTKLNEYFGTEFSKENLENEFKINAGRAEEEYTRAEQQLRNIITDPKTSDRQIDGAEQTINGADPNAAAINIGDKAAAKPDITINKGNAPEQQQHSETTSRTNNKPKGKTGNRKTGYENGIG